MLLLPHFIWLTDIPDSYLPNIPSLPLPRLPYSSATNIHAKPTNLAREFHVVKSHSHITPPKQLRQTAVSFWQTKPVLSNPLLNSKKGPSVTYTVLSTFTSNIV